MHALVVRRAKDRSFCGRYTHLICVSSLLFSGIHALGQERRAQRRTRVGSGEERPARYYSQPQGGPKDGAQPSDAYAQAAVAAKLPGQGSSVLGSSATGS